MIFTSGNYMNLTDSKRDIFVIFNEPNSAPTIEEYDTLQSLIETEIKKYELNGQGNLRKILKDSVELAECKCVDYGVQVIIINR